MPLLQVLPAQGSVHTAARARHAGRSSHSSKEQCWQLWNCGQTACNLRTVAHQADSSSLPVMICWLQSAPVQPGLHTQTPSCRHLPLLQFLVLQVLSLDAAFGPHRPYLQGRHAAQHCLMRVLWHSPMQHKRCCCSHKHGPHGSVTASGPLHSLRLAAALRLAPTVHIIVGVGVATTVSLRRAALPLHMR